MCVLLTASKEGRTLERIIVESFDFIQFIGRCVLNLITEIDPECFMGGKSMTIIF